MHYSTLHYMTEVGPSATNKWRLKLCIFLQFHLWVLLFLKCFEEILDLFEIDLPLVIDEAMEANIPDPLLWEYTWLLGAIPAIFGWMALPKNNRIMLMGFVVGTLLLGVVPVVAAAIYLFPDLMEYKNTHKSKIIIFGYPMIPLCFMFFAIALQIHVFGLYFAKQLLNAWDSKKKKVQ